MLRYPKSCTDQGPKDIPQHEFQTYHPCEPQWCVLDWLLVNVGPV